MTHPQIVLFEDTIARGQVVKPLIYTHSFAELLVGCYSAIERIQTFFDPEVPITLHVRPEMAAVMKERYPSLRVNELVQAKNTVFINVRLFITEHLLGQFFDVEDTVFHSVDHTDEILGFHIAGVIPKGIMHLVMEGEAITHEEVKLTRRALSKAKMFTSLWNMVNSNSVIIQSDIRRMVSLGAREFQRDLHSETKIEATAVKSIYAAESVTFAKRTYLDASGGPILIEDNVTFEPNATVIGPVVIRAGTLIKAGAKIHPGVTIGPVSKIGGEVENSIIQGYSNKQHDGYLGHSFIGEWCNIGAGTNTSDLRNDYRNVQLNIEGQEFETKSLFVGLLMGDHSKSAIGTQFNTGTVVGVSSNIFSTGFPPKWIPNFSWCAPEGVTSYRFEKAIEVANTVLARRGKTMSEEEQALLRRLSSGGSA